MSLQTAESIPRLQRKLYLEAANKGSPGVNGVSFAMIEAAGRESWLSGIRTELIEKAYRPAPVRRVTIPKPGGDERPLGIPTIRGRVVQTAAKLVLEPIFEADGTYGYRLRRSGADAIEEVHALLCDGYTEVVDADLQKYFDSIVLRLIKMWLKTPVEEKDGDGKRRLSGGRHGTCGTPQNGVVTH